MCKAMVRLPHRVIPSDAKDSKFLLDETESRASATARLARLLAAEVQDSKAKLPRVAGPAAA